MLKNKDGTPIESKESVDKKMDKCISEPIEFLATAVASLQDVFKANTDRKSVSAFQRSLSHRHISQKSNKSVRR